MKTVNPLRKLVYLNLPELVKVKEMIESGPVPAQEAVNQ